MSDFLKKELQIEVANDQTREVDEERLVEAVNLILAEHGIEAAEVSIALVDDQALRELNKMYLDHDYETDVLSFLLDYDQAREFLSGQIIVSTDMAAKVAEELNIPLADELLLYVVHGTLHLVGYDDTDPELASEMRAAEQECLTNLGVSYHWPVDEESRDG